MNKNTSVVLVYDQNKDNETIFTSKLLNNRKFKVVFVFEEKQVLEQIQAIYPDIVVLNTIKNERAEKLASKIKQHEVFKNVSIVALVEKVGMNPEILIEKFCAEDLVVFPLEGQVFMNSLNKLLEKSIVSVGKVDGDHYIHSSAFSHLEQVNELYLTFQSPFQFNEISKVKFDSKFLDDLEIGYSMYRVCSEGKFVRKGLYINYLKFVGLNSDVLKNIKEYCKEYRNKK